VPLDEDPASGVVDRVDDDVRSDSKLRRQTRHDDRQSGCGQFISGSAGDTLPSAQRGPCAGGRAVPLAPLKLACAAGRACERAAGWRRSGADRAGRRPRRERSRKSAGIPRHDSPGGKRRRVLCATGGASVVPSIDSWSACSRVLITLLALPARRMRSTIAPVVTPGPRSGSPSPATRMSCGCVRGIWIS
jgi:hypothetical protein